MNWLSIASDRALCHSLIEVHSCVMKLKVRELLNVSRSYTGFVVSRSDIVTIIGCSCVDVVLGITSYFLWPRDWIRTRYHNALMVIMRVDS